MKIKNFPPGFTIALVLNQHKSLMGILSEAHEIEVAKQLNPLGHSAHECMRHIEQQRELLQAEQKNLQDYLEELIEHPQVHSDIKGQALEWFAARDSYDHACQSYIEATHLIGQFAYQHFLAQPHQQQFVLEQNARTIFVKVLLFV